MWNSFIELNVAVIDQDGIYYYVPEFIDVDSIVRIVRCFETDIILKPLPRTTVVLENNNSFLVKESYEILKKLIINAQNEQNPNVPS